MYILIYLFFSLIIVKMARKNICPNCRKNKSYKNSNTKSSRKSKKQTKKLNKKQRGGNHIVYVDGIDIASSGSHPGVNISGQMAYLSKKCGSK